jgi:hypothetical protein
MKSETHYRALWHMLRRIQLGNHEDGKLLTFEDAQKMAGFALEHVPEPAKILPGYELPAKGTK